jgi:lysophospholipase L1-like esterase
LLVALVALVVLAAGGFGLVAQRPQPYAPRGQGDLYLALGDSLAWGFSLDDRAAESYPSLVGADLGARAPIATANLAVPGATTGSLVAGQLPRAVALIRAARGRGEQVSPITLDIGGNDLRSVERASPTERVAAVDEARRNLAHTLDTLRAATGPAADIAVMTYYNPYGGDPSAADGDAYWVEQLNRAIREEAGRRGVAVADVYPAFAGGRFYTHTFILFGDIHANARGHRLIADTFLAALGYAR